MDVADAEQVKAGFRQTIEKFGKLDILVNNAAITRDGLAVRMKSEDWEAVLRTNLTGAHLCAQQAMSVMMRARYGRIINVTSRRCGNGKRRAGQLCRSEGGPHWSDARAGGRSCVAQHHGKRGRAGFRRFADDRSAAAECEGRFARASSTRAHGDRL